MRQTRIPAHLAGRPKRRTSSTRTTLIQAAIVGCSAAAGVGIAAALTAQFQVPAEKAAILQPAVPTEQSPAAGAGSDTGKTPSMETVAAIPPADTPVETFEAPKSGVRPFTAADLQRTPPPVPAVPEPVEAPQTAASPVHSFLMPAPGETLPTPLAFAGAVPIAETPEEVAALEAQMAASGAEFFKTAAKPEPQSAPEPVPQARPALPVAWTNAWVNMRAGPDNDARTLAIVPGGAEIRAQAECRHWCKVAFEGQDGYIYKTFIRRE